MKTQRERAQELRTQRLQEIERQVRSGSLVIRAMTEEERERFPPPDPNRPRRTRKWG